MYQTAARKENRSQVIERVRSDQHAIVHPRMAWMLYYEQKKSVRKVCEKFGISRKTFYKWWHRYKNSSCAPESLLDESRRPHTSPNATPGEVVEKLVKAKKETGFGQRKLKAYLEYHHDIILSEHTIWKLLKRHYADEQLPISRSGNGKDHRLDRPGDTVQISFMDVSPFFNGETAIQYTAIDVTTGMQIAATYEKHSAQSASEFLEFIIERFPFPIKEVQTPDDKVFTNGSPTNGVASILFEPFRALLKLHNIAHIVLPAHKMKLEPVAKAERVTRDEFYEKSFYLKPEQLRKEVQNFVTFYNNHRKNGDPRRLTPLQRLRTYAEYKHVTYFDPFEGTTG